MKRCMRSVACRLDALVLGVVADHRRVTLADTVLHVRHPPLLYPSLSLAGHAAAKAEPSSRTPLLHVDLIHPCAFPTSFLDCEPLPDIAAP